ncbi:MAG TPA: dockerin type I domain-containing protein [Candidatus Paceibacterota bacterium]|jgi:hypothetical protein|nr:dockerin type I domain-containing protein [Candidatus Paceibacterota bacterium]
MPSVRNRASQIAISLILAVLFIHSVVYALTTVTSTGTVTITAQVSSGSSSGGGGGGGGGPLSGTPTVVNFSGMAYPYSKVIILQDGVQVLAINADVNANFSGTVNNLAQGSYTFSVYTEDQNGLHSVSFSFPIYITTGTTVNIGDIVLAPTITVGNSQVIRGQTEPIFGFAAPNSQVNINVHSAVNHLVTTIASKTGVYLYNFDTSPLEYGSHTAAAHAILLNRVSAETDPVSFIVSQTTTQPNTSASCGKLIGDINCDGKVNLVDFSIMAYWYKKGATPPTNVDLNHDGKITLIDFSILAYHWTG